MNNSNYKKSVLCKTYHMILTWECTIIWKMRAQSVMSNAVVAIFTMSAPVACILATRLPMASDDGVLWKLWEETMTLKLSGFFPEIDMLKSWATCNQDEFANSEITVSKCNKTHLILNTGKYHGLIWKFYTFHAIELIRNWKISYLKLNINVACAEFHCQTKSILSFVFITFILTSFPNWSKVNEKATALVNEIIKHNTEIYKPINQTLKEP